MGLEGAFRKVFGRKGLNPASSDQGASEKLIHPAMAVELLRFDHYRPGLGRAAINWVARGEHPETLDTIAVLAPASRMHSSSYQQAQPSLLELMDNTNAALVKGELQTGPELLRLIQIRTASRNTRAALETRLSPSERLVGGLNEMLSRGLSRLTESYKVKWQEVIPLRTVFSHFEQVGGSAADFFALILRRTETQYMGHMPDSWSEQGALAGYLAAHPGAFADALLQGEPKLRASGVKLLEHHKVTGLPEIERVLVAMLTRPFDKTDCENAISALARLEADQLLALLKRELPRADIDTRHALVQAAGRCRTPEVLALLAERGRVEKAAKVKAAIEAVLDDKRMQVRINAAVWLADIRSTGSEGALRKRLKKEKSDPVRAALIESLQRMGFNLSDVIGPASLIAEAEAACAKQAPALPDWLTANGLPVLHFRSGATVPPLVASHWLNLAIRRQPLPN